MCMYVCVWSMRAIFQNLSPRVTLKRGQGHQNLISSCPCLNNIAVQVWAKSIHSFWREGAEKQFSNNLSPTVTLKMGQGHKNLISSLS